MLLGCNSVAEAATLLSSLPDQHRSLYAEYLGAPGRSRKASKHLGPKLWHPSSKKLCESTARDISQVSSCLSCFAELWISEGVVAV